MLELIFNGLQQGGVAPDNTFQKIIQKTFQGLDMPFLPAGDAENDVPGVAFLVDQDHSVLIQSKSEFMVPAGQIVPGGNGKAAGQGIIVDFSLGRMGMPFDFHFDAHTEIRLILLPFIRRQYSHIFCMSVQTVCHGTFYQSVSNFVIHGNLPEEILAGICRTGMHPL